MDLNDRQKQIIKIVKKNAPITGDEIASELGLSRATIRPDLTILTMVNILGARPKVGYFYTGKSELSLVVNKLKNLKVKDFMSLPFVMDEKDSVYDVIVGLFLQDTSSVFITNQGKLAGVVSRKDLLRSTMGNMDLQNTPVGLVMTRMPNMSYIGKEATVFEAACMIEDRGVDAIPVVEEEKGEFEVIGRFTKTNISRLFVDLCNGEIV
ncbi:MAG: helix-turn-helix transcriptional regulator [Tissierellia bacterium]|nr:helix-turn-helix transcriptional regulator [Tissierellia bacterium]